MLAIRQGRPITIKWYVMRPPNRQPILFSQREEGDIRITVTGPGRIPFGPLNYEVHQNRDTGHEYLNITISQREVERLELGVFSILLQWDKKVQGTHTFYRKRSQLEGVFALTSLDAEDNTGIAHGLPVVKVLRSYVEDLSFIDKVEKIPTQSEITEAVDAVYELIDSIAGIHYMIIHQSRSGQLGYGEEETVTVSVVNGYGRDVTSEYIRFFITRDSGDEASDAVWNMGHTSVETEFTISFSDLSLNFETRTSNVFTVTAIHKDSDALTYELEYEF